MWLSVAIGRCYALLKCILQSTKALVLPSLFVSRYSSFTSILHFCGTKCHFMWWCGCAVKKLLTLALTVTFIVHVICASIWLCWWSLFSLKPQLLLPPSFFDIRSATQCTSVCLSVCVPTSQAACFLLQKSTPASSNYCSLTKMCAWVTRVLVFSGLSTIYSVILANSYGSFLCCVPYWFCGTCWINDTLFQF